MTKNTIKLPEKLENDLFIQVGYGKYNLNKIYISEHDVQKESDPESWGRVLLKTVKFKTSLKGITIEDNQVKKQIIDDLQAQKREIESEYFIKLRNIQDRLDMHLALEYNPMQEIKEFNDLPF